ncbi:hypothetical protein [Zavarzinella formosa]|uniref:hypothetical protein n=1 Tax=Zavarzinella formosa TaxID=360055 RepID=UPI0003638AB2|nr:hypothetical protein [Zavarzinella formosa]
MTRVLVAALLFAVPTIAADPIPKDERVELQVNQAKKSYTAAHDAASATLIDAITQAKLKIGTTKELSDAAKLAKIETLTKEQEAFEREGVMPKTVALQNAVRKYDEAISKATADFTKVINEVAKVYLDKKDAANYEALLKEKQRFLSSPVAVNLLAQMIGSGDKPKGKYVLKGGSLVGEDFYELPFDLGDEYDIQITIERLAGNDAILIGLKSKNNRFFMIFDGWPDSGYRSGLYYKQEDGKDWVTGGAIAEKAERLFPAKTPINVEISVRKESARIWVKKRMDKELRKIVDYAGPLDKLIPDFRQLKGEKTILLYTVNSQISISKLEYKTVSGAAGRPAK